MSGEALYLMSPMEIVLGWMFGHGEPGPPPTGTVTDPRAALERVVLEAARRQPCGVAFSGGRDSALVLAIATHVARREGLPDPVPITKVFPGVEEADESRWQERVVRHLGLTEWQRITIADGDLDFVGPLAARHLLRHGVVWPPAIAADLPVLDAMPTGSVLDGEGGDEVLGVLAHRIAPVTHLIRRPRPVRWWRIRRALGALAPAPIRVRTGRRRWHGDVPWLRPLGREAYVAAAAGAERERPLSFAASVSLIPGERAQVIWTRNRKILAGHTDTALSSPLMHPEFIAAVARHGGTLGRGDRTMVLREMVPDLLPDDVLGRVGKATFNGCYMSRHTREFAQGWDGHGVDHDLVDADALRRAWLAERPTPMTAALLQQAWRAQHAAPGPAAGRTG